MFGSHGTESHPHDGVGAGGKHPHPAVANQCAITVPDVMSEGKPHTDTLADPVRLHGTHALGPARQGIQCLQQIICILGDTQVVHGDFALFDQCTGAPAATIHNLLIRQHRLINGIPVDRTGFLVGHARFEHAQEEPLIPAIVLRPACSHFTLPVNRQSQ